MKSASPQPLRIAVVTGTRAEFGLLAPVMHAIASAPGLSLCVIAAGSHLIKPWTILEVEANFAVAATVPMQPKGSVRTRAQDALDTGRGIQGFAKAFAKLKPDWVVVLGDRIEAFAAASAASIGGYPLAHIHGGDRAEGVADEAMRHAISKLAHLHLPATEESAQRLIKMGEPEDRVVIIGSPAVAGLDEIPALSDAEFTAIGAPQAVMLLHPSGVPEEIERVTARAILHSVSSLGIRALVLQPNMDAGREFIADEIRAFIKTAPRAKRSAPAITTADHLPRPVFLALLKRFAQRNADGQFGVLIGNSSAGLIEAAALGVYAIDIGPRQAGRQRAKNVIGILHEIKRFDESALKAAISKAITKATHARRACPTAHPYGRGDAGVKAAKVLLSTTQEPTLLRKRNSY